MYAENELTTYIWITFLVDNLAMRWRDDDDEHEHEAKPPFPFNAPIFRCFTQRVLTEFL